MSTCNVKHPFLFESGSSQLRRAGNAIKAGGLELDGRKLADFLHYIYAYSRQVNFHDFQRDDQDGDYILLGDWRNFFEKSIPFLLANISKFDLKRVETEYQRKRIIFLQHPSAQNLDLLIDYCFEELFLSLLNWYQALLDNERLMREFSGISAEEQGTPFGFKRQLGALISSELSVVMLSFIDASRKASAYHFVPTRNFFPFLNQQIWNIPITKLVNAPANSGITLAILETSISDAFGKLVGAIRRISAFSTDYLEESLEPLEEAFRKYHEPHLGLMFAFLELFKYIQGDFNKLSQNHLDFFYQKVLKVKPKTFRPDYAHVVFEVAKHLDEYLIQTDTLFKDGKDLQKADVLFGLEEEIIIDKAQVESLRTLYLNNKTVNALPAVLSKTGCCSDVDPVTALEGVYMAPVANSADGLGKPFSDDTIPNWSTLGAKESKLNAPGKLTPGQHPYARIGFVLASPVLFLQEGRREIVLNICCDFNENISIVSYCRFFEKLNKALHQPYYKLTEVLFSRLIQLFSDAAAQEMILIFKSTFIYVDPKVYAEDHPDDPTGYYKKSCEKFIAACGLKFSTIELLLIECYVKERYKELYDEYAIEFLANLPIIELFKGQKWAEALNRLANPLSDAARAFLSNLLASQNPYIFGYDLKGCLDVMLEPSCEPMFSCCEIKLLEQLMDREVRNICYLDLCNCIELEKVDVPDANGKTILNKLQECFPDLFPSDDLKKCLPVYLDPAELEKLIKNGNPVFSTEQIELLEKHLICDNIFNISLSSDKGWHKPKRVKTQILLNAALLKKLHCPDDYPCLKELAGDYGDIQFKISIALDEEEPPIVCFDKAILQEDYQLEEALPVAKIELNNEMKLDYSTQECKCTCKDVYIEPCPDTCPCCLAKKDATEDDKVALYQFFRSLQVKDVGIDVKVCGIKKNIIVQNDENVQDVNGPILPFGVRPNIIDSGVLAGQIKVPSGVPPIEPVDPCSNPSENPKLNLVGPNFYIGSNEILKKKWKKVCLHLNWKNKPSNFTDYYAAYAFNNSANVGTIQESDFEVNISVLEEGAWKRELLNADGINNPCIKDRDTSLAGGEPHPITFHNNRELFQKPGNACRCECPKDLPSYPSPFPYMQTVEIESNYFDINDLTEKNICQPLERYTQTSRDSFFRLNLENQDFFHKDYAYILSRQVIALAKFPHFNQMSIDTAILFESGGIVITIQDIIDCICKWGAELTSKLTAFRLAVVDDGNSSTKNALFEKLNDTVNDISANLAPLMLAIMNNIVGLQADGVNLSNNVTGNNIFFPLAPKAPNNLVDLYNALKLAIDGNISPGFLHDLTELKDSIVAKCIALKDTEKTRVLIPNEPWTPTIQNLALDYSACATKEDIELIHLYPYEGTYKHEDIEVSPTLFPYFNDEGTLFIGLKDLRPGANLNLLFQLAEATADSELDRAHVVWHYLSNNQWIPLRDGFEIIADDTKGLTVSGIVKIAVPAGISRTGNTIMPADLFWIKAAVSESDISRSCKPNKKGNSSLPGKVKAICDTIAVYTQAAKLRFAPTLENDLNRLVEALPAERIAKMAQPEAGVKKVQQPYPSFGGRAPEAGNSFYQRVSEHLRHKGRSIAAFDYETMILEAFPEIFKVKCINHDFGLSARTYRKDLEIAPGFVLLAVIPDLTKLQPGQGMDPKAPVSLLEEIKAFLKKRVSPFVRLKVLNPRFEKVDINVTVKLRKGKNKAYYSAKLKEDLINFMAPWNISKDTDKLEFGQSVNYSEVIKFIELLDYVDFITCLELFEDPELQECVEGEASDDKAKTSCGKEESRTPKLIIEPLTSRSILTAGKICVNLTKEECDTFCIPIKGEPTERCEETKDFYTICKTPKTYPIN